MIKHIDKVTQTTRDNYKFCVLIPSWNNLEYLKLCINSILKNSHFTVQIIVIVNEGSDGTLDWLSAQKEIDYIISKQNIGICYGLNSARSLIKADYIVYVNDDMYLLPDWDLELYKEIELIGHKEFMLSATMIEPKDTGNRCVIVKDFGQDIESFEEENLLQEYAGLSRSDWNGSTWPPNVVHIDVWDLVGGMSIEFSPGMSSDPDLSKKLYTAGIRYFKGKGTSLAYHFGCKSTGRVKRNKGNKTFLLKWGITSRTFTQKFLKIGSGFQELPMEKKITRMSSILNKIKRMKSSW